MEVLAEIVGALPRAAHGPVRTRVPGLQAGRGRQPTARALLTVVGAALEVVAALGADDLAIPVRRTAGAIRAMVGTALVLGGARAADVPALRPSVMDEEEEASHRPQEQNDGGGRRQR